MININFIQILLLVLIYVHANLTIYSIYIHRGRCHGAVTFNRYVVLIFQCWLWLFGALANRYKVASHILHHKYSDTELDVNGPRALGKLNILLIKPFTKWFELTVATLKKTRPVFTVPAELDKIASKFSDVGFFYKNNRWGIWVNLLLQIVLFGVSGLIVWMLTMILTIWIALAFSDGIVHLYGYTNFDNSDCSKNVVPLGILVSGEELHNNHHRTPSRAKFSVKWWEFDLGWCYINILKKLKLAKTMRD